MENTGNHFANYINIILQAYQAREQHKKSTASLPKIKVNPALSSLALIYEKIRTAVDFRAEHLFRRAAIERILRRYLLTYSQKQPRLFASNLIKELVWSRYLPNNTIPKAKIDQLAQVISKHWQLQKQLATSHNIFSAQNELFLQLLATEIDELLVDQEVDEAWAKAIGAWLEQKFVWLDPLSPEDKDVLIYIAIRQAFLKSDPAIIRYHLFLAYFPQWINADAAAIVQIAHQFPQWQQKVEGYLHRPLGNRLFRFVQNQVVPLFVLREIIEKNWPASPLILADKKLLVKAIRQTCQHRYRQIGRKVQRGIVRSIIYIFATKMLLALFIEIPYEIWLLGRLSWLPLSINIAFPPSLMFFIGLFIHPPGEKNTQKIIHRLKLFLHPNHQQRYFQLLPARKSRLAPLFKLFYLLLFLISFGGLSWLLWKIGFNPLSGAIFFFFLSLVLLFGFRVRWAANELKVTAAKEGLFESLLNILALPFLDLGVKLSIGLSRLNILMVLLDFLIEAPLKIIISVIGEWVSFIRQKRAEAVEVPF